MNKSSILDTVLRLAAAVAVFGVIFTWIYEMRSASELDRLQLERRSLIASIGAQRAASEREYADEDSIQAAIDEFDLSSLPTNVQKAVGRLEDPRFAHLTIRQLDADYAALFRMIKLPEEKLNTLKGLLAERLRVEREAIQLSMAENLVIDELPDERAILAAGTAEIDGAISQTFGADTNAAIEAYQATLSARKFMIQPFANHLQFGSDSLSDSQFDELSSAASEAPFGANTIIARPPGPPIPTALDEAVGRVLSPAQQQAYQEYKTVWDANRQKEMLDLALYVQKQTARANAVTQ